jgi:hypothetical protein
LRHLDTKSFINALIFIENKILLTRKRFIKDTMIVKQAPICLIQFTSG